MRRATITAPDSRAKRTNGALYRRLFDGGFACAAARSDQVASAQGIRQAAAGALGCGRGGSERPDGGVVAGTLSASRLHGLLHEVMDAAETMRRFPAFKMPPDHIGVFQPDGGFIAVEPAIATMIAQAQNSDILK